MATPEEDDDREPRSGSDWGKALEILAISVVLPVTVLAGVLAGAWLGGKAGSATLGGVLGGLIGAAAGFYEFYRLVLR